MDDSFKEDDVEKEVAFLTKNFQKFLKIKNNGKSSSKGKFSSPKGDRKGKVFATTLSDSESSISDMEGECDSERNYRAFMAITSVDSKNDLSNLVDELGDLSEDEEVEELEDEDVCQNEGGEQPSRIV